MNVILITIIVVVFLITLVTSVFIGLCLRFYETKPFFCWAYMWLFFHDDYNKLRFVKSHAGEFELGKTTLGLIALVRDNLAVERINADSFGIGYVNPVNGSHVHVGVSFSAVIRDIFGDRLNQLDKSLLAYQREVQEDIARITGYKQKQDSEYEQ